MATNGNRGNKRQQRLLPRFTFVATKVASIINHGNKRLVYLFSTHNRKMHGNKRKSRQQTSKPFAAVIYVCCHKSGVNRKSWQET